MSTTIDTLTKKLDALKEKKRDTNRKIDAQIKAAQRALKSAQERQLADDQLEYLTQLGADTPAGLEALKERDRRDAEAGKPVEGSSGISDTIVTEAVNSVSENRELTPSGAALQPGQSFNSWSGR